jgi:hypothetical protein
VIDARDAVARLVFSGDFGAESDNGTAEVTSNCRTRGSEDGYVDVFPRCAVSWAIDGEWLWSCQRFIPVRWVDCNMAHLHEDGIAPQPGHRDGLYLCFANGDDPDSFHGFGNHGEGLW